MRLAPLALLALLAPLTTLAQAPDPAYGWPTPPSRPIVQLWRGTPPHSTPDSAPEANTTSATDKPIAGRPIVRLGHVTTPTMTLYLPASNPTGTAVLVFPGGGYSILAIDLEGTEVCQWLNSRNIACLLVKYRVPGTGPFPKSSAALADAQRALALARAHAADWHLNPDHIGALGFSAGAHLAAALSTHTSTLTYPAVDAADRQSIRPDFAVLIYPGYLALPPSGRTDAPEPLDTTAPFHPTPDVTPTAQTPPTFLLQAEDDPVHVENSTVYFQQLKQAHVPAELHVYAEGGHGYGLRPTALPITHWPALVETWLHTIGILQTP